MAADAVYDGKFELKSSREFARWLFETRSSIAFTTYQGGKLFLIGLGVEGRLSIFERSFPRSMGLAVSNDGQTISLATQFQIQRFDNVVPPGTLSPDGFDALFVPHAGWVTGDIDAHDVGFDVDGRPFFVNTLFSCIAAVSDSHSFKPIWRPSFISSLAPEDRCHLNGMAMDRGEPQYVTAVAPTDEPQGWRARRADGGVVIDVHSNDIVARGLSMPHSPRLHHGRLWLLNSGAGELGFIHPESGRFEAVAFCPGYARGLALIGDHAVVGLSLARENQTFSGLPLDSVLQSRGVEPFCGLAVFNLTTGAMVNWVRIDGLVGELYDVAMLPDIRRPSLVGFKGDEIRATISIQRD